MSFQHSVSTEHYQDIFLYLFLVLKFQSPACIVHSQHISIQIMPISSVLQPCTGGTAVTAEDTSFRVKEDFTEVVYSVMYSFILSFNVNLRLLNVFCSGVRAGLGFGCWEKGRIFQTEGGQIASPRRAGRCLSCSLRCARAWHRVDAW